MASTLLEETRHGAFVLALTDALTLVELLLAAADADDKLGITALTYEQTQGYDRDTRLLLRLVQLTDFLAIKKQLALAALGVVVVGAVEELGDVHILHPDLAVVDITISVHKTGLAQADALYLRAGEHYAGRESVRDGIVKPCAAVFDVYFLKSHFCHNTRPKIKLRRTGTTTSSRVVRLM